MGSQVDKRRAKKPKEKKGESGLKHFMERDDVFLDYVMEDVYIRNVVGKDAVRAHVSDGVDDEIVLYSNNRKAIEKILKVLSNKDGYTVKRKVLRKPTKDEVEDWLAEQSEIEGKEGKAKLPW
jgi:hypothetical protein